MDPLLVVVGRDSESQVALRKAVVLARHLNARVDLFLCESEPASAASEAGATRILEALRGSIAADDVIIEAAWAGGTSLRDGVACRLRARPASLILRSIRGGEDPGRWRASPAERELASGGYPVPLWLARRPAWAPQPRFAMSPGPEPRQTPSWSESTQQWATMLARGGPARLEVLQGLLPDAIDALFLPAPPAGDDASAARAELLIDQLDCDLVFIPAAGAASPMLSPSRAVPALSF